MSKHGRILVAMSGGLDSTVTAVMLREEGYEVVGVTMKTWDYATSGGSKKETGCCSLDSINDARTIAVKHGIHHMILDIRDEFGDFVIDNFVEEYLAGRTPNPCVLCNTHIKWEALLKRANQLDCEFIATGHYAQVRNENNRFVVSKGIDENKDQSYVLWGLTQASLAKTRFPLGGFRKTVTRDGKILGKHRGYPFYTIGQRKGLEIALGEPMYVLEIQPETNTVVLGHEEELNRKGMWVRGLNLGKYASVEQPMDAITKIRYKNAGTESVILQEGNRMKVIFHDDVKAIAPGQSAVFYEGNDVIGGGWIESSFEL